MCGCSKRSWIDFSSNKERGGVGAEVNSEAAEEVDEVEGFSSRTLHIEHRASTGSDDE